METLESSGPTPSLPKYNRGVLVCIQDFAVVFGEGVPPRGTGGAGAGTFLTFHRPFPIKLHLERE